MNWDFELEKYTKKEEIKIGNKSTIDLLLENNKIIKKIIINSDYQRASNEKLIEDKILLLEKSNRDFKSQNEELLKGIMNILDEVYRLNDYVEKSGNDKLQKTLRKNIKYINYKLKKIGLEKVETKGEFDEDYHECIQVVKDIKEDEKLEEVEAGYLYKGNLIRASKVIVYSNK